MAIRINRESGVIEEDRGLLWESWQPVENENGNEERLNPETGVLEENRGLLWDSWVPKE